MYYIAVGIAVKGVWIMYVKIRRNNTRKSPAFLICTGTTYYKNKKIIIRVVAGFSPFIEKYIALAIKIRIFTTFFIYYVQ